MSDWLRPDEAAAWLGISVGNLRVLAHRRKWRRQMTQGRIAYHIDDVGREVKRRATLRKLRDELHR